MLISYVKLAFKRTRIVTNKDIQTERLLRYFLDAAKNIIKSEGLDALTVRSVADKAGYSYGTLYNYYKG